MAHLWESLLRKLRRRRTTEEDARGRRPQQAQYDEPDSFANLSEVAVPIPVQRSEHLNKESSPGKPDAELYDEPDNYANLSEVAAPEPVQNPEETVKMRVHRTLEEERQREERR